MLINDFSADDFLKQFDLLNPSLKILNAGSSSRRFGSNCVNLDIQDKPGVDVVCDILEMPESFNEQFDVVLCTAVLQYCADPFKAARKLHSVLKPGGYLFINAPWIQGYCRDTPDKFRFSKDGLRVVFDDFEIQEIGVSIRPGSAWAYLAYQIAEDFTTNRYANFCIRNVVRFTLLPFRWINSHRPDLHAGAFYLIGRKEEGSSDLCVVEF